MPCVGILALQGDVSLHAAALGSLGVESMEVRKPGQLDYVDALTIPGGESSALLKLMSPWNFMGALCDFANSGKGILGTCAGAILLSKTVMPAQASLQLMDITVERNAYGRQLDSFTDHATRMDRCLGESPLPLVFIRAPRICRVGQGMNVMIQHQNDPVLVQQGKLMAATFHPEMGQDNRVMQHFLKSCLD